MSTHSELSRLEVAPRQRFSWWRSLVRFARSKPLGAAGGLLMLTTIITALVAPVIAPYSPLEIHEDYIFARPQAKFLLGTDELGRDVLSRVIWGSRISLYVGLAVVGTGATLGALVGAMSAYFGGKVDLVVQRFVDSLMAFPSIILAMVIMAALGQSLNNVVIALAIVLFPNACRTVRSQGLSVKETQYVEAAKAIGCSHWRIILRHILPNCFAPFLILATVDLGVAIVAEASLSFLGMGTPPPTPSWGGMLTGAAQRYVRTAPWLAFFPGIALSLTVFGFNLLGDALRDTLDPRLRRG